MARRPTRDSRAEAGNAAGGLMVRLIRVFVSSPGDVAEERRLLDEVVVRVNETAEGRGVQLKLFKWEKDVVPRIGPAVQKVIDDQTPPYDIYLGILKHRFGTPTGRYGSGTEKEFRDALKRWGEVGTPWILFYFSAEPVPRDQLDEARRVERFRQGLRTKGFYATYEGVRDGKDAFVHKVEGHLRKLVERMTVASAPTPATDRQRGAGVTRTLTVPAEYRAWLKEHCSSLDLEGLKPKQAMVVPLNAVYVPLTTQPREGQDEQPREGSAQTPPLRDRPKPQLLLDRLGSESLYVPGDPGSGKSTFCRRVALLVCEGKMPSDAVAAPDGYAESFPGSLRGRLPILVALRDFWRFLPDTPGLKTLTVGELEQALARWLDVARLPGLDWPLVEAHLDRGSALVIVDGVDEVPLTRGAGREGAYPRAMLVAALAGAVPQWTERGNRVLVTSRPYGLNAAEARRLGVAAAPLQALDEALQHLLVRRWFHALADRPAQAEATAREMLDDVQSRPWLAPLMASPLLLTATCVLHHEGKRLPQDRYELYDRIVDSVLYNRYLAGGENARERLRVIAYGMHTGAWLGEERSTPRAEADLDEIDRIVEGYREQSLLTDQGFTSAVAVRDDLLSQSGLLLPRADRRAAFLHLSIQEFLAAERLRSACDAAGLRRVFVERAARPEWHSTLVFLFGALFKLSPEQGGALLRDLIAACDDDTLGLAVVAGQCLEIPLRRGLRLPQEQEDMFRSLCLRAIDREVAIPDRWQLGIALGNLGDPRLVTDLRDRSARDQPAYVEVKADEYRVGEEKRPVRVEEPFLISRHPVTNDQYRGFVNDGGYDDGHRRESRWWSTDGRRWLKKEQVREPAYWRNARWNAPNQPVVGVSFWEAEAFCRWAGGRLPSELEWEAAARGPQGHEYPWGDTWEDGICNSREAGLGVTSPVGLFPRSRSKPYGLEDMAGNVWEWCADFYDREESEGLRVVRGGSWVDGAGTPARPTATGSARAGGTTTSGFGWWWGAPGLPDYSWASLQLYVGCR